MTGETRGKLKASICGIGEAIPPGRSALHPDGLLRGWIVDGGDYPGVDFTTGKLGGWSAAELTLIAETARVVGDESAIDIAERCR